VQGLTSYYFSDQKLLCKIEHFVNIQQKTKLALGV